MGKLNGLLLSIFKSFYSYIKKLRIKNNTSSNVYDIKDLFGIIINSCSDNATLRGSINKNSNFNDSYLSTLCYWLNKLYVSDLLYDMYYKIYHFSECIDKSIFISNNDPLIDIYNEYNVLAGDGTISNTSFKNNNG